MSEVPLYVNSLNVCPPRKRSGEAPSRFIRHRLSQHICQVALPKSTFGWFCTPVPDRWPVRRVQGCSNREIFIIRIVTCAYLLRTGGHPKGRAEHHEGHPPTPSPAPRGYCHRSGHPLLLELTAIQQLLSDVPLSTFVSAGRLFSS